METWGKTALEAGRLRFAGAKDYPVPEDALLRAAQVPTACEDDAVYFRGRATGLFSGNYTKLVLSYTRVRRRES